MSILSLQGEPEDPTAALEEVVDGFVDLALPFVRIYLGPAARIIEGPQPTPETNGKVMLFALHKFMVEAGTLPPPTTSYEPHTGTFSVDPDGQAPALDLRHVLAALRVLAAWAAAGPTATASEGLDPATPGKQPPLPPRGLRAAPMSSSAAATASPPSTAYAPVSARALRISARTSGYALASAPSAPGTAALVRTSGGCGCRGSSTASTLSSASRSSAAARRGRAADCRDPKPRCDCGGSCGGVGCGCPAPAAPPAPEACTPWSPSCEARNRLRACLKDILCELLRCIEEFLCPGGSFGTTPLATRRVQLVSCIAELLCKLLRCVREALCPPPPAPELPCPLPEVLPCSFAVEDPR
jgi:hypothetical protein